MLEYIIIIG